MQIEPKIFEDAIGDVAAMQGFGEKVFLVQPEDEESESKIAMARATFLAVCRHLGVTKREPEGTDA